MYQQATTNIMLLPSNGCKMDSLPTIPLLPHGTFDSTKNTPTKRLDDLMNCPDPKRSKTWLEPRKQSDRPKQEESSSSPRGLAELVDEGRTSLSPTPTDFQLSIEYIFSTPKASNCPTISDVRNLAPFPTLSLPTASSNGINLVPPCVTLKPRIRPRFIFPQEADSTAQRVVTNIESSSQVPMT